VSALLALDSRLFDLINRVWTHPVLDAVMVAITDFNAWRVPLILVLLAILAKGRRETRIALLFAILAVACSDQLTSGVLKPLFHRVRPFHVVAGVRKLIGAHDTSFPSSHAANSFAAGTFLALRFRRFRPVLVIPALVAYSRVYVGVHWPSDVAAGAVVGAGVGGAFFALERMARLRFLRRPRLVPPDVGPGREPPPTP